MKKTVKNIVTLMILTLFFVFSSGLMITVHQCCHKHHHSAQDHRHCSENTYVFKITSQYTKSSSLLIKHISAPELSLNNDNGHLKLLWDNSLNLGQKKFPKDFPLSKLIIYQLLSHLLL